MKIHHIVKNTSIITRSVSLPVDEIWTRNSFQLYVKHDGKGTHNFAKLR